MAATITYATTTPITTTTQATQKVYGTIAFTGSYTTGGDTLNFTATTKGVENPVRSNQRPIKVLFWEEPASGTNPSGLEFYYRNLAAKPSASNGTLQILGAGTSSGGSPTQGNEIAASTYPTILTATTLKFEAEFPLGR